MLQGKTPLNNLPVLPAHCPAAHISVTVTVVHGTQRFGAFHGRVEPKTPALQWWRDFPAIRGRTTQKRPRLDRLYLRLQLVTRFFGLLVPEWTNLIGGYVGYSFRKLKTWSDLGYLGFTNFTEIRISRCQNPRQVANLPEKKGRCPTLGCTVNGIYSIIYIWCYHMLSIIYRLSIV